MPRRAAKLLEEARQLPHTEREWLLNKLLGELGVASDTALARWQKDAGDPEPGYDEWFRAGVEEALADTSPGVPHEEAMKGLRGAIDRTRKLKRSA
ncbi:MAG: hypothetical protein WCF30_20050 [Terracidiphilus sp.]